MFSKKKKKMVWFTQSFTFKNHFQNVFFAPFKTYFTGPPISRVSVRKSKPQQFLQLFPNFVPQQKLNG